MKLECVVDGHLYQEKRRATLGTMGQQCFMPKRKGTAALVAGWD